MGATTSPMMVDEINVAAFRWGTMHVDAKAGR